MKAKKGCNNQPIVIPYGFKQSGQAMERPGLTVARNAVTLIPFVGREIVAGISAKQFYSRLLVTLLMQRKCNNNND